MKIRKTRRLLPAFLLLLATVGAIVGGCGKKPAEESNAPAQGAATAGGDMQGRPQNVPMEKPPSGLDGKPL